MATVSERYRDRVIPVDSPYKRDVLERAKILAKTPNGHVGQPGRSLKSNLKAYDNTMAKLGLTKKALGVTGHGLRHQFANDGFEQATGCKTPVRGGRPGEVDKAAEMVAKAKISEELGHTRASITAAYFGRHTAPQKHSSAQRDLECAADNGVASSLRHSVDVPVGEGSEPRVP